MLTPEGTEDILELVRGFAEGAVIRVFQDDDTFADAPMLEGFPKVETGEVVCRATFGPEEANFQWARHAVVIGGKEFDAFGEDLGVKAAGSVWTLETRTKLATRSGS